MAIDRADPADRRAFLAVRHARQKGIIHRDLKPTNILVAGMVGTTLGLAEARRQESEAHRQQGIAVDQRRRAEMRLTQLGKMNEILGSIFQNLDPNKRGEGRQAADGGAGRAAGPGEGGDRG